MVRLVQILVWPGNIGDPENMSSFLIFARSKTFKEKPNTYGIFTSFFSRLIGVFWHFWVGFLLSSETIKLSDQKLIFKLL